MNRQAAFRAALTDPAAPVPEGLQGPGGRPAGRRFDIYRNNVAASLAEALETGFPAISSLVGAARFRALALEFLRAHPPASPVLSSYGTALPGFLEDIAPRMGARYLPDVARLELALRDSYHAADSPPLAAEALAGLPARRLVAARLRLAPALRLVRSAWPVLSIHAYATGQSLDAPPARPEDVLVTRPGFDPLPRRLGPGAAACLDALMQGEPLGTAQDAGLAAAAEFDLGALLAVLLDGGAIIGLDEKG
ncbi:MAG: DUF2063 domain-containing protein [Paracoccaceae bacterium]